jgi:hypothetical protein
MIPAEVEIDDGADRALLRLAAALGPAVHAMLEASPPNHRRAVLEARERGGQTWIVCSLGAAPVVLLTVIAPGGAKAGLVRRASEGWSAEEAAYAAAAQDVVQSVRRHLPAHIANAISAKGGVFTLTSGPTDLSVSVKVDADEPSLEVARLSFIGSRRNHEAVH